MRFLVTKQGLTEISLPLYVQKDKFVGHPSLVSVVVWVTRYYNLLWVCSRNYIT